MLETQTLLDSILLACSLETMGLGLHQEVIPDINERPGATILADLADKGFSLCD